MILEERYFSVKCTAQKEKAYSSEEAYFQIKTFSLGAWRVMVQFFTQQNSIFLEF